MALFDKFDIKAQLLHGVHEEFHHHPEVVAELDKVDRGLKGLESFLRLIPASAYPVLMKAAIKTAAAEGIHIPVTDEQIAEAASEASHLPDGIHGLEAAVEKLEAFAKE